MNFLTFELIKAQVGYAYLGHREQTENSNRQKGTPRISLRIQTSEDNIKMDSPY